MSIDLKEQPTAASHDYPIVTVSGEYLSSVNKGDPNLHNIKCIVPKIPYLMI